MQASVIIPNYNRADALALTLSALAGQSVSPERFEVILVDDGSTDDSVSIIQGASHPYTLCPVQQENLGPGAARNLGAGCARASLLVFLDVDMIPAPELLANYLHAYQEQARNVLIGRQLAWPPAFASQPEEIFDYVRGADPGPQAREVPFYYMASGNCALSADLFWELGGFDERLRMTEDTDLAYRAHLAGARFAYLPEALGYHNHPKTLEQRASELTASAWWTAHLMAKHPGMRGQLPVYREVAPLDLRADSPFLVVRKLVRRLLALSLPLAILQVTTRVMQRLVPHSSVVSFLHRQLQCSYRLVGFRRGLKSASQSDTSPIPAEIPS